MHSQHRHNARTADSLPVPFPEGDTPIYSLRDIHGQHKEHLPEQKMPGVRCPTCNARGIEQWVLPGKHCPICSTPC